MCSIDGNALNLLTLLRDRGSRFVGNTEVAATPQRIADSKSAIDAFFDLLPEETDVPPSRILFLVDGMRPELYSKTALALADQSYFAKMRRAFMTAATHYGAYVIDLQSWFIDEHAKYWRPLRVRRQSTLVGGGSQGRRSRRAPQSMVEILDARPAAMNHRYDTEALCRSFRFNQHVVGGGFEGEADGEQGSEGGRSGSASVEDGMGRAARRWHHRRWQQVMESLMPQPNDLSRCLTAFEQSGTIVAVVEMSQSSWLVAGIVPGVARHPLKKLAPDPAALLALLRRWQDEATKAGCGITRIAVAYEAGRDGFWLARWLRARSIEAQVIHPTSVAVSREHRRAKTDRLDTGLLKRAFLGWLRGEPDHCSMAAIPTLEAEDAKRPNREHQTLVGERTRIVNRMKGSLARLGVRGFKPTLRGAAERLVALRTPEDEPLPPNTLAELRRDMARLCVVKEQIKEIEAARLVRLAAMPDTGPHAMVRLLARVIGLGLETADMLVHEILARDLRDRRAVARFAGLTGAPDESGKRRRDKGLAKAGSARVRRGMIQLAWRFLLFQRDSALAQWYRARTADARGGTRKTMIVALARKLLIALWRMVTTGEAPEGVALRPAT